MAPSAATPRPRQGRGAESQSQEQYQLLRDIIDTVSEINPLLRSIIRDQGNWDLDRLEERAREVLGDDGENEYALSERRGT